MLLEMAISLRHFLFTLLLLLFLSSLERQLHYCTLQKEEVFGQKKRESSFFFSLNDDRTQVQSNSDSAKVEGLQEKLYTTIS